MYIPSTPSRCISSETVDDRDLGGNTVGSSRARPLRSARGRTSFRPALARLDVLSSILPAEGRVAARPWSSCLLQAAKLLISQNGPQADRD